MSFKDIIGKITGGGEFGGGTAVEDYVELEISDEEPQFMGPGKFVKVCKLKGFADVDITARELSEGNIVILDIKPLAERSMNELKHAVDEIKDICVSMGGDIAGLSEYHLIMTPPNIKIERSTESRVQDFEDTMERVRKRLSK